MITLAVLTISDKGSRGERIDESGRIIMDMAKDIPADVREYEIVPDEVERIEEKLIEYSDEKGIDLIITTGGTGVSPRDVTPDATSRVIEKELPGMSEAMRMESFKKTAHALISRGISGIRKQSIIINLPGSPKAVRENFQVILPALRHAVEKLKGDESDCSID